MGRQSNRKRSGKRQSNDGKRFERLTAALHVLKHAGAKVQWDDKIDGRQVDVSVRFAEGSYTFLIIIECRDLGRSVEVGDVEAFVTKSRSLGAHLGVMVSAAGFQDGAKKVAAENKIELFTLSEVEERLPAVVEEVVTIPTANILKVRLILASGERIQLSDDPNYLSRAVGFMREGRPVKLGSLFKRYFDVAPLGWDQDVTLELPGMWTAHLPERGRIQITSITARLRFGPRRIKIRSLMPPEIPDRRYKYANVLTGAVESVAALDMPIGFDTEWVEGGFYRDAIGREYLCVKIAGDEIHLRLLNSLKQHGYNLWINFSIKAEQNKHYVRLTESADVQRLEAENERYTQQVVVGGKRPLPFIPLNEQGAVIVRDPRPTKKG